MASTAGYDVLWPRSQKTAELIALAERPSTLAGAKVAFLWDYLFRGDEIFPVLQRELTARFPGVRFIHSLRASVRCR